MSTLIGYVWMIQWHSPYTEPPDGKPRVLGRWFYPYAHPSRHIVPPEIEALHTIGDGYTLYGQAVEEPPKPETPEKKAHRRQARLRTRMTAKYPLFADQMIDDALQQKPDYYAGTNDDSSRQEIIDAEWRAIRFYLANQCRVITPEEMPQ